MPIEVNIRHLEHKEAHLEGELPIEELDLDLRDEMAQPDGPLEYDLEAQKLGSSVLVQGLLALRLKCQCVRCLKPFESELVIDDWAVALALEGEEKVAVVNDSVDLTAHIREDILLTFPQHPLCEPDCRGLPVDATVKKDRPAKPGQAPHEISAWAELDKLKLKSKN